MNYKISVIIRTYNEEKHIEEVLKSLKQQSYPNYEIIIVDSESTDKTIQIVKKYDVKIVKILKKDFNYSYASNIGVQNSNGDICCFLSGHSVPFNDNYLELINDIFQNVKIGGCYGDTIALEDGSITEKAFNMLGYLKNKIKNKDKIIYEKEIHPGILSCSNAAIRKELLLKYPFANELGKNGGEDVEVAYRIMKEKLEIVQVSDLLVKHSHGKGFFKFIKEFKNWRIMYGEVLKYIENKEIK